MEQVDLIASGYEWTCPECERLHHEIEILEKVYCIVCDIHYETGEAAHAYG